MELASELFQARRSIGQLSFLRFTKFDTIHVLQGITADGDYANSNQRSKNLHCKLAATLKRSQRRPYLFSTPPPSSRNMITPPIGQSIRSPVSTSSGPMGLIKPLRPARHSARVPRSGVYHHCEAGHLLGGCLELVWFCRSDWPLVTGCIGELVAVAGGEVVED